MACPQHARIGDTALPTIGDRQRTPSSGLDALDFDRKLRLIMRTLSVGTQKELRGLLQDLNPQTAYTPGRAYKWVTGRAVPRDPSVFDDLAHFLSLRSDGEPVGGEWLRTVDFATFFGGMADRFGDRVAQDMAPPPPGAGPREGLTSAGIPSRHQQPVPGYVTGTYLAISPAWSAHRGGEFVLGEIVVSRDPEGSTALQYREYLGFGDVDCAGPLNRRGRSLQALAVDGEDEETLNFVLAVPSAPGILLCGVMSGIAMHDAEARVVAGRIVGLDIQALRRGVDDPGEAADILRATLRETGAYCDASADGIQSLLEKMGAAGGDLSGHAAAICSYLDDPVISGVVDVRQATINDLSGFLLGS